MDKTKAKNHEKPGKKGFPAWAWIIVVIAAIAVVFFSVIPKPMTRTEKMPVEISVEEAAKLRDKGAFILDVREQSEWDQFHIPGATLIPLGTLQEQFTKVPKDQPIVVVCRTGHRSAQGRDILLQGGYENVTSMAGGVTEWQAKGLPIETGK
jgi:rhodanese-related sulfurtransferase